MSQVGAPVRIVGLIGMLAALGVAAWSFTAGHSAASSPSSAAAGTVAANPIAAAQSVAGKLSAHNEATAAGKADAAAPAAAAAKPKAAAKAKAKAAPVKQAVATPVKPAAAPKATAPATPAPAAVHVAAPNETPTTIASLLRKYPSVVVLLYNPRAQVDAYSVTETELGARNAHAGFLRVDVLNQRQAAPFTQAYGVLQDPTVLFFARPGKLIEKFSGFADHETVSQAALNAALGIGSRQQG